MPGDLKDSHVTREDILKIGGALIGYRHVSTAEQAQQEAETGVKNGCALNISFCWSEVEKDQAKFANLDERIVSGENCDALIKDYEKAITGFIEQSIGMDFDQTPETYKEALDSLDCTRFMIINPWHISARDASFYMGLGRFPKAPILPKDVILLRPIKKEDLQIPKEIYQQPLGSDRLALRSHLVAHYRRELLRFIREDFKKDNFNSRLSVHSRHSRWHPSRRAI